MPVNAFNDTLALQCSRPLASDRDAPPAVASLQPTRRCEAPGPWLVLGGPHGVEWNHVRLPVAGLPRELNGLRILHVTDFHLRNRWYPALDGLLSRIGADPPDLLIATGDFGEYKHTYRPSLPHVLRLIDGFRAKLGVYGITGNHDAPGLARHFAGTRLTFMEHRREIVRVGGATIDLIGLAGHHRKELDAGFVASVPPQSPRSVRLVMSHHPDHVRRTRSLAPDLFLSGHTHGGQVCLPSGFPLIRHDKLPRRYVRGVHRYDDTWLVVNRGVGFSGPPVRLFCPAEVLEIRLVRPA
jgi:predicted MPP superfamily phosphohydrolase